MRFFGKSLRTVRPFRLPSARPVLEILESRLVPYATTGNAWPNPQLVTISFVPDGTVMALGNGGQITSNLFAAFSKIPGVTSPAVWQGVILKAAQSWASQTNINFAVVPDDGSPIGSGADQQGDPEFGDIRIGGYNVGSAWTSLAATSYPPPVNNYSVAGDVTFNTNYGFQIGQTFDLYTVAAHEIGHALGLDHSATATAVMYPYYTGAFAFLGSDDIAGIRNIYSNNSPRSADAYDAGAGDNTFANAANVTSAIQPGGLTAVVGNLDITSTIGTRGTVTAADLDYYKFTAPAGSAPTMTVSVQSAGLSLLSPLLTVYAADQKTVLGTASGRGQYGTTLTLSGIAVTPGATYYVKVQGADTTVFSTGAYALTLNLGTGANPTVPLPNTTVPDGNPESGGGGDPLAPAPTEATVPPSGTRLVDANVVASLGSRSTLAPVVLPTATTSAAAPIATPAVTTPAAPQLAAPLSGVYNNNTGDTPTEERGSQPAPPPDDEASPTAPSPAAPSANSDDDAAAACDACLAVSSEQPAAAPTSSVDAVAAATSSDWTHDGALALASVLFAGTWLRRDAAHRADEKHTHDRRVPTRPKVN